nr:PREDICTED: uncharacterized protein LOC103973562 isoform X1 [Musa acuminata subsp. malaccensis]
MAESADEGGSRDPALGADGDPRRSPKASTCKGKSCKGCLYYSWRLKSDARIPVGVGIGRTLPQDCFGLRQLTTTGILRKNSSIILQYLTTSSVNLKWKLQKKAVACQISSTLVLVIQFSLIQKTIMLKSQRTKQSCHFVQALRCYTIHNHEHTDQLTLQGMNCQTGLERMLGWWLQVSLRT